MHGNVWEWIQDCYNDSYSGAPSDGSAWESGNCSERVLRGGSWFDDTVVPPRRGPPQVLRRRTVLLLAVSVLPGRLPLESSPLYLFGGGGRGNEDGALGGLRGFFDFFGRVLWSVRGIFPFELSCKAQKSDF